MHSALNTIATAIYGVVVCSRTFRPIVLLMADAVRSLLMGWLLISYIPQWARIVSRKSAEGLSTFYILLGSVSGVCAVGNILMLPSTEADMGCCTVNSRFACISGLLGTFQVIFGVACFWIV